MRLIPVSFSVILFVFASLQYNDPDAPLWIAVYCIPALLLAIQSFKSLPIIVWLGMGALYLGILCFFSFYYRNMLFNQQHDQFVEVYREFGGLCIILIFIGISYWRGVKSNRM